MKSGRFLLKACILASALIAPQVLQAKLIPTCTSVEGLSLPTENMRLLVSGVTLVNKMAKPINVYATQDGHAQIIVGSPKEACVRYVLAKFTEPGVVSVDDLSQERSRCRESKDGVPTCETVQEIQQKLRKHKYHYAIEGTMKTGPILPDQDPSQKTTPMIHLVFCTKKDKNEKITYLCMDNRRETTNSQP